MGKRLNEMRENFRVFFFYLRKYKRYYAIGITSLVVVDTLEVLPPLLLKWAIDELGKPLPVSTVFLWLAAAYVGVAIVQGFMRFLWRQYIIRTSMIAANDMRQELFGHLSVLSPGFFKKNRVGELVSLSTNDIESVRFALGPGALTFFDALFYFIAIPPIMFWLSPKLALISLLPMIFLPKFVRRMEGQINKHFLNVQNRFSDLAAHCQESLGGIRVIKGAALERFKEREFAGLGEKYVRANVDAMVSQSILTTALELFVSVSLSLLFLVGGALVVGETITIGVFVAFQRYIQKMTWPMEAIGLAANILQRSFASQKRLDRVLLEKAGILAPAQPAKLSRPKNEAPRIEVRGLTFSYPGKERPALFDLHFTVEPGMKLGLIGSVGSGKSTLLAALARMEAVPAGNIFFDGVDVTTLAPEDIRQRIGFVPQEVFLFSRTVEENLLYGSSHLEAAPDLRREKSRTAATIANVEKEIERLPLQYSTVLGERGVNLSGGQKQRLSIARAVAREPGVLLFDDCLSAVDTETEARLIDSLDRAGAGRSIVLSTHRYASLERLDWVLVLQAGRIVDQGRPSDILARHPLGRTAPEAHNALE